MLSYWVKKKRFLGFTMFTLVPFVTVTLFHFTGLEFLNRPGLARSFISIGTVVILALLIFKGPVIKRLFVTCALVILTPLVEGLVSVPLGKLMPGGLVSISNNIYSSQVIALQFIVLILYSLVAVIIGITYKRKRTELSSEGMKLFILFPFTQAVILVIVVVQVGISMSFKMQAVWLVLAIICAISDVGAYKAIKQIGEKARVEQAAEFYQEQLDIQLSHYQNFSQYDASLSHLRHDIANQVEVIRHLIDEKEYGEAGELLSAVEQNVKDLRAISYCGDKIINALVFTKYQQMKEDGIEFNADLKIAEESTANIEKSDLCRVFANVLDNALEYCEKYGEGAYINIKAAASGGFLLIKCSNPISESPKMGEDGWPVTSKEEKGHGNGLAIIRETAEKYSGSAEINMQEKEFTVSVRLNTVIE